MQGESISGSISVEVVPKHGISLPGFNLQSLMISLGWTEYLNGTKFTCFERVGINKVQNVQTFM